MAADNPDPRPRGRRRQAVTIKHVAADAGVSLQTVSRVINDGANVSPEMKARVQSSIDKLGYVPSIAAQRMSGSRSYLILALNDRDRTIADWSSRQGVDWVDQMLLGRNAEMRRARLSDDDRAGRHAQRPCRARASGDHRRASARWRDPDPAALRQRAHHAAPRRSAYPVRADRLDHAGAGDQDDHGR